MHRSGDLSQQISRDAEPFRIQWLSANRLSRPTIPTNCVALIAFLAMQIGWLQWIWNDGSKLHLAWYWPSKEDPERFAPVWSADTAM